MARRKSVNETGIKRLADIPYHDAWVAYSCVSCKQINYVQIGQILLTPKQAVENCVWSCEHCGFVHAKESDIPFDNWGPECTDSDTKAVLRFWEGFFRIATENATAYWKQCNVCGRILPFSAFSKHSANENTKWGPLNRQMECRSCKGAINAVLNPKRTQQQLHEANVRRRVAELFVESQNAPVNIDDLFVRFDSRCFKTKKVLNKEERNTWAIDHILPSKYLYPLTTENAALLCTEANSNKRDMWPSKFYTNNQLIELARITGANLELISHSQPIINRDIDVNNGVERYLQVREASDLPKRILELKKIIEVYQLSDNLSEANRRLLGL